MRQTVLVAVAATVATVTGVAAYIGSASGQSNEDAGPIYGVKIPDGYRDWRLISVKRLTGAQDKFKQLRAELANDIAFKALRGGAPAVPVWPHHCRAALERSLVRRRQQSVGRWFSRRRPQVDLCRGRL